eukprot:gene695-8947_t
MSYTQFQDEQEYTQQNTTSQNVQYTQQPSLVNPITHQDTSWVIPASNEPVLAVLANLFIPGLGHVLIGQYKKGIMIWVLFGIINSIIAILACFLIGIPLLIVPLIQFIVILYDCGVLADRLKRGIPVMEGECATSLIKPGLSLVCKPVFNNTNLDECPQEWVSKMQSIQYQQ